MAKQITPNAPKPDEINTEEFDEEVDDKFVVTHPPYIPDEGTRYEGKDKDGNMVSGETVEVTVQPVDIGGSEVYYVELTVEVTQETSSPHITTGETFYTTFYALENTRM